MSIQNGVTIGIFTDLHLDIMHDGKKRFDEFMAAARKENVDFIIQLGDFCYPEDTSHCECSMENIPVNLLNSMRVPINVPKFELLHAFNSFEKPSYHVLGNHEFDFCCKSQVMKLYGMQKRYYSFVSGGWKFLVLDANNFRNSSGEIVDYYYGDYFDSHDLPYIDDVQMEWIEAELMRDEMPVVVFSHQPLIGGERGIKNADALHKLFARANENENRVKICINGHIHVDTLENKDGIYYYTLNSMSNHWLGQAYECIRYDEKTEAEFPNLRYTLPYQEPLYAIITLDENGMQVKGTRGDFVKPMPKNLTSQEGISASIESRNLKWL